jgi:hypothetical protein
LCHSFHHIFFERYICIYLNPFFYTNCNGVTGGVPAALGAGSPLTFRFTTTLGNKSGLQTVYIYICKTLWLTGIR